MKDFFYYKFNPYSSDPREYKRPQILALTASPIKQKLSGGGQNIFQRDEILNLMQNLSNNLFSKFVTLNVSEMDELKKEATISIEVYQANFLENFNFIKTFEQNLIQKIIELIPMSDPIYKMAKQSDINETILQLVKVDVSE